MTDAVIRAMRVVKGRRASYRSPLFRTRMSSSWIGTPAAPHPAPSRVPIGSQTVKAKSFFPVVLPATNTFAIAGHLLDVIAKGIGDNERIGSNWEDTAVHLKGTVEAVDANTVFEYFVVWDKQPNQATALYNDVFAGDPTQSFYRPGYDERFVIIKKFRKAMSNSVGSDLPHFVAIDDYIKLPKGCIARASLTGVTGTIAARSNGALLIFPGSNKAGLLAPIFDVAVRVYFNDV